jgi:sugar transferase (PEP-CTERM system associated)
MSLWGRRFASRTLGLVVLENALIVGSVLLGVWIRLGTSGWWHTFTFENGTGKAFVVAIVCQICFYFADLYDSRAYADRRELLVGLVQGLGLTSLVLAVLYFWFPALIIGRGVFLTSAGLVLVFLGGTRLLFEWLSLRPGAVERLLLVGTGGPVVTLARELFDRRVELGVEIVGFVDPDETKVGMKMFNPGVIGTIDDIPAIARNHGVNRVVVSLSDARGKLPMNKLLNMKLAGVQFDHLASVYEEYTGKIAVENLRPSWLIFSAGFQKSRLLRAAKRAIDIAGALAGLVLGLPLMVAIAIALKLTSRGHVLYHQKRVGEHGRVFTVHKFRSMRMDAEAETGAIWARQNDDRITRVGHFLRRTRLDELPQFWNILIGEMSLVGPRPERPEFVEELTAQLPFYGERHTVRPGLTGWAQVRYTYGASVEDALEKLQYDLFYVKNHTLTLDFLIILNTIKTVILRRGAA